MNSNTLNKSIVQITFWMCLMVAFPLSGADIESERSEQSSESEFELFLWFSELEPDEAETLANKDPDELHKDLELSEKLFASNIADPKTQKINHESTQQTTLSSNSDSEE